MNTLSFITIIASIVTIISGLLAIFKRRYKWLGIIFIFITSILAISLSLSRIKIQEQQAEMLAMSEPLRKIEQFNDNYKNVNVDFKSNGELKGIVMSGMMILETYKDDFPKTYVVAEKMFYKEHGISTDKDFWDERQPLEEATEAMIQIMKNLYIMKMTNQAN